MTGCHPLQNVCPYLRAFLARNLLGKIRRSFSGKNQNEQHYHALASKCSIVQRQSVGVITSGCPVAGDTKGI